MASLSSTGSVTSSNSLGNTSLRGFGGMVSGIQRDEIIEAMTLHTTNKITNQKSEITKLQWKQEAYRGRLHRWQLRRCDSQDLLEEH